MQLHTPAIRRALFVFGAAFVFLATTVFAATSRQNYDLKAAPAETALKEFSAQSGQQVIFPTDLVRNVRTRPIKGDYTPQEALDHMLADTNLVAVKDEQTGAFAVRKETPEEAKNDSSRLGKTDQAADGSKVEGGVIKLETFEVMGSKLLNMDIPRDRNGPLPYVVFNHQDIESSGAANLDDFLKTRLPMNTVSTNSNQNGGNFRGNSSVNLRGFGSNQTLILVDGRRQPGSFKGASSTDRQPDLNGIPLGAIERIEVLPASASSIYGGGATGGVLNVILRKNYAGLESTLTYGNTFESDTRFCKVDIGMGMTLEGGKTNVLLLASYSDQEGLLRQDRNIYQRALALELANNPSFLTSAANFPLAFVGAGSTANIMSADGSNLTLKGSNLTLNSPITFVPAKYTGAASDGGQGLIANAGRLNTGPGNSAAWLGLPLMSGWDARSLLATVRRQFSPVFQAFVDAGLSKTNTKQPSNVIGGSIYSFSPSAANNPFNQAIQVTIDFPATNGLSRSRTIGEHLTGGMIFKLPRGWQVEADYNWTLSELSFSSDQPPTALRAAISAGTFDVLRDLSNAGGELAAFGPFGTNSSSPAFRTTLTDSSIRGAGPIFSTAAGALSFSGLLEHRDEELAPGRQLDTTTNSFISYLGRDQSVNSAYAELHAPLVGKANQKTGVQALDLQIATRWDAYKTNGVTPQITSTSTVPITATNRVKSADPSVAVRYQPFEDLVFRASYGTGFLPPTTDQIVPRAPFLTTITDGDPLRGNTAPGQITQTLAGNPNLKPERSKSLTVGAVFTPRFIPGLRASLDYTNVRKSDNITTLSLPDLAVYFPERITRGPNLPTDQPGWAGPITAIDFTSVNISRADAVAYDAQLDYRHQTQSIGTFDLFAVASWETHFRTQVTPAALLVENAGNTANNPLKFKASGTAAWEFHRIRLGWSMYYFNGYWLNTSHTINIHQGSARVASQLYHDVFVTLRGRHGKGASTLGDLLANTDVTIGVHNVFNKAPILATGASTDGYSRFADPRLANYWIMVRTTFR